MSSFERRPWFAAVMEGVVAVAAMVAFLALAARIRVDPMQRIGQVSGLASLQLRFAWFAVPLIALLIVSARRRRFALVARLVCAAFAGLASAFVAGGIAVALRNTPYCLNAHWGDSGTLALWANAIKVHYEPGYPPPFYPPLFPWVLRWYMGAVDLPALYALKDLQIGVTALVGPLAYLAWRTLLRPGWALGIGVVGALAVIEPYKPYENVVLVLLVPLTIRFLQTLRRADERTLHQLLKAGVLFGIAFGVLCLTYSGWFRWSAPGVVAAALIVFPWRAGRWKSGLVVGGVTLAVFVVVLWGYLWNIDAYVHAAPPGPIVKDNYVYFDVLVDPAYFAIWKGDLPGTIATWPPPGELAGLGLYSLLGFAAFGAMIAFARARTVAIALASIFGGAWLMRFWYAHLMYHTHLVQLYPRTSIELAYLVVVIGGFASYYAVEYVARRRADSPLRDPSALIGAVIALALVIGATGSSIADRYMPAQTAPRSQGELAWQAHDTFKQKIPPDPP